MSFDVSTVQVSETTEVVIKHPVTGDDFMVNTADPGQPEVMKPMVVIVHGPGSKTYKAAQAVNKQTFQKTFHRGKSRETPEQEEARTAAFLSACTVELRHFDYKGMPSSGPDARETFRALYLDAKMGWLTEQVDAAMGDWANFTQAA